MPELDRVTISSDGRSTTALGFGCSNLLGDKTPEQGKHLLATAFDAGVRHFDVARYYGFGEAETLVGQFAKGKRDSITIATKFGLEPMQQATQFKGAVQLVRGLMRRSNFIKKLVRRRVNSLVRKGQFDVPSAQRNLEISLRLMQTDYIDIYLLHDCEPGDCTPELLEFLNKARDEGKIRRFGVGTGFHSVQSITQQSPGYSDVTQFESNLIANHASAPRTAENSGLVIHHGVFRVLKPFLSRLASEPAFAERASEVLGHQGITQTELPGVLLRYAILANPGGLVLFRSANPKSITSNVSAATRVSLSATQVAWLTQVGAELKEA